MNILTTLPAMVNRLFRRPGVEPFEKIGGSDFLGKAASDTWDYCIGLRTGLIVHCSEIEHCGEWIHITGITKVLANGRELLDGDFLWGRGIEARVSEVAWVADCDS